MVSNLAGEKEVKFGQVQDTEPAPGPLLVVGVWRSGTSLLYTLLNKHPQIGLMYEGELALLWPLFLRRRSGPGWLARWNFWNLALERHQLLDVSGSLSGESDLKTAMEVVYKEYARRKGASIWGCKSPNYYDRLTRLAGDFPGARVIVIWRDPISICRSVVRAAQGPSWFRRRGMSLLVLLGYQVLKRETERLSRMGAALHERPAEAPRVNRG